MKLPLAWLQLSHQKLRLAIALAGICFADVLMFMQLGFRGALFESAVTVHRAFEGDIFLMSPQSTAFIALNDFSRRRLYQALAVEGVASVAPLYVDFSIWKNPVDATPRAIMVIGTNPQDDILNIPEVRANKALLQLPDYVLFDRQSRPEFGPIPDLLAQGDPVRVELDDRRVTVAGLMTIGASFGADGNVVTSDRNFLRIFSNREPGLIDVGVIRLHPEADPELVAAKLREYLPEDVLVFDRQGFIDYEKAYWQSGTSIGFVFTLGTVIGLIVGIVIVYQILYTDVSDHLPEYATLKAMGYTDRFLLWIVFQEAVILACVGFIPGAGFSALMYALARQATSLPMLMTAARLITVFILTMVMCMFSGGLAMRRLQAADPAEVFA